MKTLSNWLGRFCQEHITDNDTVLDLGCGIQQGNDDLKCLSILGVDIFDKYLNHIKNRVNTVKLDLSETDRFMDESYDVVLCLDVIEHFDYELALKILDECKRICRKRAIVYTPKEFKNNKDQISNSWNMGNNPHQEHKCVINRIDLKSKYYIIHNIDDDSYLAVFEK